LNKLLSKLALTSQYTAEQIKTKTNKIVIFFIHFILNIKNHLLTN